MFDKIYTSAAVIARHRSAPLLEERLAFLAHLASQGYSHWGLQKKAGYLFAIVQILGSAPQRALTLGEIKRKMTDQRRLYGHAVQWLQFMGRLQPRPVPFTPWAKKIQAFAEFMECHHIGWRWIDEKRAMPNKTRAGFLAAMNRWLKASRPDKLNLQRARPPRKVPGGEIPRSETSGDGDNPTPPEDQPL